MGSRILRTWFDGLEESLQSDAALAGLLGHGTLIGDAREFFVRRVLKTVLPPAVHVGTGRVIGSNGQLSNQVDVVVYDPTFPLMEIEKGQGLYFIEGVIATIEVKSTLDKEKLFASLSNCHSVTSIPNDYRCATYIFAFGADTSNYETFGRRVVEWLKQNSLDASPMTLPRVTIAGSVLCLTRDDYFRIGVNEEELTTAKDKHGPSAKMAAGVWRVKHRFGWLLSHLGSCCMKRTSLHHKWVTDEYWPVMDYFREQIENETGFRIWSY